AAAYRAGSPIRCAGSSVIVAPKFNAAEPRSLPAAGSIGNAASPNTSAVTKRSPGADDVTPNATSADWPGSIGAIVQTRRCPALAASAAQPPSANDTSMPAV